MIYYRISDNNYKKERLPGSTKWNCFSNFIENFKNDQIEIILDNCEQKTIDMFYKQGYKTYVTSLSNAGSLNFAFDLSLKSTDDIFYFVEDDYLHQDASIELISEGLQISDYVTLYDHPDKYSKSYDFGEISKVVKTYLSHWRYTISTCMTFATTKKILIQDREIWNKHTNGVHPNDHQVFCELKEKGRNLAVCIPGRANHCDLNNSQESWAIQEMIDKYILAILTSSEDYEFNISKILKTENKLDQLKMLSIILSITSTIPGNLGNTKLPILL